MAGGAPVLQIRARSGACDGRAVTISFPGFLRSQIKFLRFAVDTATTTPALQGDEVANILAGDSGIVGWAGDSRFVATGSDPGVATGKGRGRPGTDRFRQDLHL